MGINAGGESLLIRVKVGVACFISVRSGIVEAQVGLRSWPPSKLTRAPPNSSISIEFPASAQDVVLPRRGSAEPGGGRLNPVGRQLPLPWGPLGDSVYWHG